MKASHMSGEISRIQSEIPSIQSQAASLRSEAARARQQTGVVQGQNEVRRRDLGELLKVVYNLRARVNFKEGEWADLHDLNVKSGEVVEKLGRLNHNQNEAQVALDHARLAHVQWMSELDNTTVRWAPKFATLKDVRSIHASEENILAFTKNTPDQTDLVNGEEVALAEQRNVDQLSRDVQRQIREIGSSRGLVIYNKNSNSAPTYEGDFWKEQEISVYKNTELAMQADELTKLFRDRRNYLLRVIPLMWQRMLNVRVDSVNLKQAVDAGQGAMTNQNVAELVLRLNDEVEVPRARAIVLLLQEESPRLSRLQVNQALDAASRIDQELGTNESTQAAQLRAQLKQAGVSLRSFARRVNSALTDETSYLERRRLKVNSNPSVSPECVSLRQAVLTLDVGEEGEAAYVKFQEVCP
jgi:hypothetical protein